MLEQLTCQKLNTIQAYKEGSTPEWWICRGVLWRTIFLATTQDKKKDVASVYHDHSLMNVGFWLTLVEFNC